MIKRPVKYDPQDMSIQDANFQIICHPWHKVGEPTKDYNERGQEIADCINGNHSWPNATNLPLPKELSPDASKANGNGHLPDTINVYESWPLKIALEFKRDALSKTDLKKLEAVEKKHQKILDKLNEKYAEVKDVPVQA